MIVDDEDAGGAAQRLGDRAVAEAPQPIAADHGDRGGDVAQRLLALGRADDDLLLHLRRRRHRDAIVAVDRRGIGQRRQIVDVDHRRLVERVARHGDPRTGEGDQGERRGRRRGHDAFLSCSRAMSGSYWTKTNVTSSEASVPSANDSIASITRWRSASSCASVTAG